MNLQASIDAFLDGSPHAVVGASAQRYKYGNKVLRCYQQNAKPVYPINPRAAQIEGVRCYSDLADLVASVGAVHGISIVTRPHVTEQIIEEAHESGIEHVWMQPGAESPTALRRAETLGMNLIAGGPCILVTLGYRERE